MNLTSIHQPSYFPWQGLLNKIKESEKFIVMEEVQFLDGGYQNRNIFLDKNFSVHMLTIPIEKKNYFDKTIKEMRIADKRWQKKHLRFLMQNYNRHPHFEEILEEIEPLYTKEYNFLVDILIDSMSLCCKLFEIETQIILQSDLLYNKECRKSDLIFELLKCSNSKNYLSGVGAKGYQTEEEFEQKDIKLFYQDFKQTSYEQYKNSSFAEGLSSLDLLFNVGKNLAHNYI
ncbi:MAG: WbqC family protein [Campylobacterales bacterium]|nr:WbqC family protein [Campylobacterales bacterium]